MSDALTCVTVERLDGETPRLVLRGEVTVVSAASFHEAACELLREDTDILVSCEELGHIDASALQILLALRRASHARARSVRVCGLCDALRRLLQTAGVDSQLLCSTPTSPA